MKASNSVFFCPPNMITLAHQLMLVLSQSYFFDGRLVVTKKFGIVPYRDLRQPKANVLRELQSAAGEELRPYFGRTLLPSVLDRAFKGEL
jgi:hypothetical protein